MGLIEYVRLDTIKPKKSKNAAPGELRHMFSYLGVRSGGPMGLKRAWKQKPTIAKISSATYVLILELICEVIIKGN